MPLVSTNRILARLHAHGAGHKQVCEGPAREHCTAQRASWNASMGGFEPRMAAHARTPWLQRCRKTYGEHQRSICSPARARVWAIGTRGAGHQVDVMMEGIRARRRVGAGSDGMRATGHTCAHTSVVAAHSSRWRALAAYPLTCVCTGRVRGT